VHDRAAAGAAATPPPTARRRRGSPTGERQHRVIPTVGHNLREEDPAAFADAVWELARRR
jgi:pimeloyl-ACP methyl ester carboxylesterase